MEYPNLIDSRVMYYMQDTLQMCHNNRVRIYSIALNIGVLILFVVITFITLYYCYKQKPTPYELKKKMLKDQDYVLSKIRHYQAEKLKLSEAFQRDLLQGNRN
jgi:hypothetical protein